MLNNFKVLIGKFWKLFVYVYVYYSLGFDVYEMCGNYIIVFCNLNKM